MKKRIFLALCMLMLIIMASGTVVLADGFTAPEDGAYVLVNEQFDIKFVVSFTAANNQTYCNISVEDPNGEKTEVFDSNAAHKDFEATASFTPVQEGTYKITAECGSYIYMQMGFFKNAYRMAASTTDTINVNVVKTLPAAEEEKPADTAEKTGKSDDAGEASEKTGKDDDAGEASEKAGQSSDVPAVDSKTTTAKKKANTMTVKAKAKTVKVSYKTLQKKNISIAVKKAFVVNKAKGKVTYKKVSGSGKITVSKSGKITVKKKTAKGNYKIAVKVTAAGNKSYKAKSKTVKLMIAVK